MDRASHMTPRSSSEAEDARAAWRLVQLARLAGAVEELAQDVRARLDGFVPGEIHAQGVGALDADRLHAVLDDVCALRDAAEQLGMIGGSFAPRDHELNADADAIADAAAGTLMEGGSDLWMVELAVGLLDRTQGFPALADAIEIDPLGAVTGWGETTVGELLGAFRGDDAGRSAYVCAAAGVSSEARWSNLGADTLARVCAALRAAATPA